MEISQHQVNWSFVQRVLDSVLEWPGNFVHVYGCGLLQVKFRVHGVGYEIVFDENIQVQKELTRVGRQLKKTGEFYKMKSGCIFSDTAPDGWIFIHLFPREKDADGSTRAGTRSDQC